MLHYYSPESLGQDLPHFSVETIGEDGSLNTHQVITDENTMSTTMFPVEDLPAPTATIEVPLSDLGAAQQLQNSRIGADLGTYNIRNNSCLTNAGDILRAGGCNVPASNAAFRAWVKQQLGGG